MKMPYAIRYNTVVAGSDCGVKLRGIFEDGKYFGDIVVWGFRFGFNVEGYFSTPCIEKIFESVDFLKNTKLTETEDFTDCVIGTFPVGTQEVFFRHYIDYEYDDATKRNYESLISLLKNEFDVIIQKKINEYK